MTRYKNHIIIKDGNYYKITDKNKHTKANMLTSIKQAKKWIDYSIAGQIDKIGKMKT